MWDFTVRGWRVATTCDIENLFGGEQTAVLPQRKVRKLQYEDTKIGEAYFSAIAFIVFTLQQIKQGIDLLEHPVWYGMVWYGMVWYGMVWYGMVWYGMLYYNVLYCTLLYL